MGGSVHRKGYKVTNIAVYPPYLHNPTSHSGYDLALVWRSSPKGWPARLTLPLVGFKYQKAKTL